MFRILSGHFKPAVLFIAAVVSLGTASVAQAGIADVCFKFIAAQDYPRALSEAKSLLKRKGLARVDEREIQMCFSKANLGTDHFREALPALLRVEALSRSTEELAVAYYTLGLTYHGVADLDRAELYTQRAIKAFRELGDKGRESTSLNNLGNIVQARGDLNQALTLFMESLALAPDESTKPPTLNSIAMIYLAVNQFDGAAKLLRQAIDILRREGDFQHAAIMQINLGDALVKQGELVEAERELTAGLNAVQLIGDYKWVATACISLAELEERRQDIPAARAWYRKAELINRALGQTAKADAVRQKLNQIEK